MTTIYIAQDGAHCVHEDGYDEPINYPDPLDDPDAIPRPALLRRLARRLLVTCFCALLLFLLSLAFALWYDT